MDTRSEGTHTHTGAGLKAQLWLEMGVRENLSGEEGDIGTTEGGEEERRRGGEGKRGGEDT